MIKFFEIIIGPVIAGIVLFFFEQYYSHEIESKNLRIQNVENRVLESDKHFKELAEKHNNLLELTKSQANDLTQLAGIVSDCCTPSKTVALSDREQLKKAGVDIPSKPLWKTILDISWVKASGFFGQKYQIDVGKYATFDSNKVPLFVSVSKLDENQADVVIVDSGKQFKWQKTIKAGESQKFQYQNNSFRFNLVKISEAGFLDSLAMYFSIDILAK